MAGRGMLTEEIKAVSRARLGYEITQKELRLMPYIISVMMDSQKISPDRITTDEREILSKWREHGHIEGGASSLTMTKAFWDALSEIVWLSYATSD